MFPKVGIIIVHYGSLANTIECLDSISNLEYPHFQTIVIDNSPESTDQKTLYTLFPTITVLCRSGNLGYAEGNNRGITYAIEHSCLYMLLLNNDTVVAKNILSCFVEAAQNNPTAGCLGAKIYYYDEPTVLWHTGGFLNPKNFRLYHKGDRDSDIENDYDKASEIEYACGCAIFVTKQVIETVGLLSQDFFLLWEEVDWCWRIRSAGYKCLFIPQAKVWHKISSGFEGGNRGALWQYFYYRNRLIFLQYHMARKQIIYFYFFQFPKELFEMFLCAFYPWFSQTTRTLNRAALIGIFDYCRGFLGAGSHEKFR